MDAMIQYGLRNSVHVSFVWEDEHGEEHHFSHNVPAVPRKGETISISTEDHPEEATHHLIVDAVNWDFDTTATGTYVQVYARLPTDDD